MFNWLRRWQNNRKRQIFRFWDGRRNRTVDPMVVWRSFQDDPQFVMESHPLRIDAAANDANDTSKPMDAGIQALGREAQSITVAAVRRAFGLPAFDAGGLSESECLGLFVDFMAYIASLKKSTSQSVTLPLPTGVVRSDSPQLQEPETVSMAISQLALTKPTSPCGC